MRRLLSFFFALSLLLTNAAGEAMGLPERCPQEACCCGTEESCCPPAVVPRSGCGQDQTPSPTSCGRSGAPIQTAQLPQAPDPVSSSPAAGDPFARPWPATVALARPIRAEAIEPRFSAAGDGALERAPGRLSILRILRI
ncbi:MAG: hypothetical protein IPQ13_07365 [Holophagaceae bacterium]|nr:hypothetical protein [Holophagaceae bacterium]